jgi:hypothetical protein
MFRTYVTPTPPGGPADPCAVPSGPISGLVYRLAVAAGPLGSALLGVARSLCRLGL